MHQVAPTGARLLSPPPKPLQPPSRPAAQGVSDFVYAVRTAGAQPLDAQPDIIDVEVLWEDGEEAYAPPVSSPTMSCRARPSIVCCRRTACHA